MYLEILKEGTEMKGIYSFIIIPNSFLFFILSQNRDKIDNLPPLKD